MTDLSPTSLEHRHLDVGKDTFALSANGVPLRFTPLEKRFLVALDKHHDLQAAVDEIGKDINWANGFFKKPKIYEWMTKIAQEESAAKGMTVRWGRAMLMAVIRGKETYWEGECGTCHVKQKTWLEPDDDKGILTAPCLACQQPILMNVQERPMKLDRQQMVALQELLARTDPKTERIQVQSSDEDFIFKAQGD